MPDVNINNMVSDKVKIGSSSVTLSRLYSRSSVEEGTYIYVDPNARDILVSDSTKAMLYNSKVVVQSVWRLFNTEEGEIPNFRNYGINIRQFLQYPLTDETINAIYEYVKRRVEIFENRAQVIRADVDIDFSTGKIFMIFFLRMLNNGEVVKLPTWTVQVSSN